MKIILGVTGSIAAYKAYDIVRYWVKDCSHQVRVVLTSGALKFVVPEVFRYLGAKDVYGPMDDFDISLTRNSWDELYQEECDEGEYECERIERRQSKSHTSVLHIELAKWCDRIVIAPLSANTMARLSQGQAPDLLTSIFLAATSKAVILYPAMNTNMLDHSFTQENIRRLKTLANVFVHPTAEGILACGDLGRGKLPDVNVINELATIIPVDVDLSVEKRDKKKHILITTGATISPLDPVRYLTNSSSGITGYYLAKKFLQEGHKVTVIAGAKATAKLDYLQNIPEFNLIRVVTPNDMFEAVIDRVKECDAYISSAAIGDIEFNVSNKKIKKHTFTAPYKIEFKPSIDVLSEVLKIKRADQIVVSFAAECSECSEDSIFIDKWKNKQVDLLVGNFVDNGYVKVKNDSNMGVAAGVEVGVPKGFVVEENEYYFVVDGHLKSSLILTKEELAKVIYSYVIPTSCN
ncbi:MAG: bifunctional phosphopantothenoylcysteine decarboxylase/phosphopantothenate--cysteine ligase CoaBC [Oligoflexia bacterium]|nr:bifunctional phosphopantothenoylcysteine decarboxylase/phosphopantothenate--cysteine ligase CoaBC [Oligoflexia bacterium]